MRVRTLWKVYLPPTPFLPGARSGQNQKSTKNKRFYKVSQPRPSKTSYPKGGGSFGDLGHFGRENSRSKINLFDACRISCFFASSFLVCDGHWSKKLEVKNQLIRRLSNKLLFRHEKSRAEPEASNSLTSKKLRGNTFKLEFFRPKARSVEKTRGDTFRLEFFRLKTHSVEKTHGDTFKLEIFRPKARSVEKTRVYAFRLEFFRLKAHSVEKTQGCTFKLELFRLKAHSVEKTQGCTFKLEFFRLKAHSVEKTRG